jgi:TonB family protein
VLASGEEGATLDALRFSLASDIVELVVLTADEAFLQTLREAVGEARRVWHVPSSDKVSDLLVAGEVGILVLDVQTLHEAPPVFIGEIKRQFPDLVVVAAGNRDAEISLAGLISTGIVYRFIHKPMSPGRAKLFADAAVRKYGEQRRLAAAAPAVKRRSPPKRAVLAAGAIAALGAASAIAIWVLHSSGDGAGRIAQSAPPPPVAESPLREERLDEASTAIDAARKSGVETERIAFLTAQLAKSREQAKTAQQAERLLLKARGAIDRRDFAHASIWLESAKGIAAPAKIAAAQALLAAARRQADADAWTLLLKNATDRLQQDRLIEPANDSAKYYLLALRGVDPGNPGLAAATQDLGTRLVAKARRASGLAQYDAARTWLEAAAAIGFASAESRSAQNDLDAAVAGQKFMADVVAANELGLVKSVKPIYPTKAEQSKTEGWVELDFTVAESGAVRDIAVHGASAPGVFEDAAIAALSQWRYKPVLRDAAPHPQRARIRIRFVLPPEGEVPRFRRPSFGTARP